MAKTFTYTAAKAPSENTGPSVDYDALNKYLVATVNCASKPEAVIGVISGVIDLGLQKQEDAKMEWKGTDAEKAEIEEKAKRGETAEYFQTLPNDKKVPTLYKRWPVKAQRSVAVTFDVPSIMVNRGKFFDPEGGGEDLPFRGLLNNEYGVKGLGKIVGKPYSLREQRNDNGTWSLKNNTILHKIAQAVDALDEQGNFKPNYLGNLIGKAAMFNIQVSLTKVGDKEYLNEKMGWGGPVPKMIVDMGGVPTLPDDQLYMINFSGENEEFALRNLRQSVITQMMLAEDFIGSDVEAQLIKIGKIKEGQAAETQKKAGYEVAESAGDKPQQSPQPKATPQEQSEPIDFDSFDDDIPF